MKKLDIICEVNENLTLALVDCRENRGHDDSLPYQADIYVHDKRKHKQGEYLKCGDIWNDGWGGPSCLTKSASKDAIEYLDEVEQSCKKHQYFWNGEPLDYYTLVDLCDFMADIFVDNRHNVSADTIILYKFEDEE